MTWYWNLHTILPLFAALTLSMTAGYILIRYRNAPASVTGSIVLFGCAEIVIMYLLEVISNSLLCKILWNKIHKNKRLA